MKFRGMKDLYDQVITHLDRRYCRFVTHVLQVGYPCFTEMVPTTAVWIDPKVDPDKINFGINANFAKEQSLEVIAFAFAHETFHALWHHPHVMPAYDDPKLFNIAADCVINDYLARCGLEVPDFACTGKKEVGINCSSLTVMQVYRLLKSQGKSGSDYEPECGLCVVGIGDGGDPSGSNMTPEERAAAEALGRKISDMMGDSPELFKVLGDMGEEKSAQSRIAGDGQSAMRDFASSHEVELNWAALLREIDPDLFPEVSGLQAMEPTFKSPRKKLSGFGGKVILPVYEGASTRKGLGDKKPMLIIAIDTSGSVSEEAKQKFMTLVQSVPRKSIKLFACTFTTEFEPFDPDDPHYASGGTDFSCIEDFVQHTMREENLKDYPKSVVVITDGAAGFGHSRPTSKEEEGWVWLLQDGSLHCETVGRVFELEEYV